MPYLRPLGTDIEIGLMDYQAGTTKTIQLNRENEVKHYSLMLSVTHNNGVDATFSVTDLIRLITEIRIVAGGRNNIKMVNALKMYLNNLKNDGIVPHNHIDVTSDANGLTSWVEIIVPMNMFDMRRPIDSIFPTYRFQNLDLKCTFGSNTSVGNGVTIVDGTVTVSETAIENLNRDFDYGFFKEIMQSKKISATNPKEEIRLPTEMLYKQITIFGIKDNILSDDIVKGVVIKAGSKIIKQLTAQQIKSKMMRKSRSGNESEINGMLVIDFSERGHGTEFIDTRRAEGGFLQLSVELDVVSAGTDNLVEVYSDYFEAIPLGV